MRSIVLLSLLLTSRCCLGASVGSLESALGLVGCLSNSDVTSCLKSRGMSILDDWLLGDDDKDDDGEESQDPQAKNAAEVNDDDPDAIPAEMPPFVNDIVDRLSDSIANMMGDEVARQGGSTEVAEDRGHKKKKKKAIRRAIIKLIIIALLIKHKLKMLLVAFQTFLMFKFVALIGVYVIATIVKVWAEIKHKHHPQKVIYYENAHHQHVYDSGDKHSWWHGLWGRSIDDTTQTPKSPHSLAYSAYTPKAS